MPILKNVPANREPLFERVQSVICLTYLCNLLANCAFSYFREVLVQSIPISVLNGKLQGEVVMSCSVLWLRSDDLF